MTNRLNFIIPIYIIHPAMPESPDAPPENHFYEHLTQLIRLFRALLLAFDDTHDLMRTDQDYDQAILRLRKIINQEEQLAQQYELSLQPHRHLHSAYHRFVCRLVQNLAASKAKSSKDDLPTPLAEEFLLRVENCINLHRKQRNVGRLFRRIFAYALKFCEGCDMLLSCCSQNEAIQLLKKQAENDKQKNEESVGQVARPPLQTQSESAFHKIMVVYNRRFSTISCLDLDYNSYKTYCYMSRSDSDDELLKDFLNRNLIVSKAILRYSKHFTDYLRKKEKTLIRKNRFRELKEVKNSEHTEGENHSLCSRQNPEENKKSHTRFEPKTEQSPIVSLPALHEEKKRILQPQNSRKSQDGPRGIRGNYQLKSIYLTINKAHDKFETMHTNNRFLFNYSLPKPMDSTKKYTTLKVNDHSLKSNQINTNNDPASASLLMHYDRNQGYETLMFEQLLYHTKIATTPRTSIIHKCHKERKGDKRNIRITNLTFRAPNYSKLNDLLDPEAPAIY